MLIHELKNWFFLNRRALPWRDNPSPYEVWVSEVMLQQTQVSVVIPYFKKWMTLFPTITALAHASSQEVLKAWEGLGYYSRARNLHEGARALVKQSGGELPSTYEELRKVKGIGPYTVGAILSFAYREKRAAVDGNVFRVLSRYYGIMEPVDQVKVQNQIRDRCQELLPDKEPWILMEALIELGALVCQKKAKCLHCPLQSQCFAAQNGVQDRLPFKSSRVGVTHLKREVAVIVSEGALLIQKGEEGKVMADLYEFPYVELGGSIGSKLGLSLKVIEPLSEVTHSFTRFKAMLYPSLYWAQKKDVSGCIWVLFHELDHLPFSSGHRKILKKLKSHPLFSKEKLP